jgi:hypothetical protein
MNSYNLKQQEFFGEHTHIDGNAGKKQTPSQNLPSHNYGDQTIRPDYQTHQSVQGHQSIPVVQAGNAQFGHGHAYGDQTIRQDYQTHQSVQGHQSIPVGQVHPSVQGHQSIPVGQAGNVPFGHGHGDQTIRPDNQAHQSVQGHHGEEHKSEQVHLNATEGVNLTSDAEHVHITTEQGSGNVEQVIRIKPDGKVQVTTEKVGEHEHERGKETTVGTADTHHYGTEHGYGREGKLGTEHGRGTTGYDREGMLGKHDDTHHYGKNDHADTHRRGTDETKLKGHDDTHKVYKEHHGNYNEPGTAGHVKGGKHHHLGTDATKLDKDIE